MSRTLFDLVFENGDFWTGDPKQPRATSIGVVDGRILAVSDGAKLEGATAGNTIDLGGRTVFPGINDSHVHSAFFGASQPPVALDLSYPGTSTLDDVRRALRDAVERTPAGQWIRGNGFDAAIMKGDLGRWPTKEDLDDLSPNHPVIFVEYSTHLCWVNSAALAAAGVETDTTDPDGGVVVRGDGGAPSGMFLENAQALVTSVVPNYTEAEIRAAVQVAGHTFASHGITSITDAALGSGGDARANGLFGSIPLNVLTALVGTPDFPVRTNVLLVTDPDVGFEPIRGALEQTGAAINDPEWFRVAGVKLFADGVPPSKTAYMADPYCGGGHGSLMSSGLTEEDQYRAFEELIDEIHSAGYQMGVHTTGDRASTLIAESFARARARHGNHHLRHYLIHADFVDADTLGLLSTNGWGINTQPAIKWTTADAMVPIVGEARAARQWPLRSMLDSGVPVGFSSDAPVTAPDWRRGVVSAVLRESRGEGRVSGAEERISYQEALAAYTSTGAWFDGAETWKGTLAPGKVADLCVMDRALSDDVRELEEAQVSLTVAGGKTTFEARS